MENNSDKTKKAHQIVSNFLIGGEVADIKPFGSGHINDTYRVFNSVPNQPDYLLQRVNHHIFKDVPGLINNIAVVTGHVKSQLKNIPGANLDKEVLTLIQAKNGLYYYQDDEGQYWRLYLFLRDTKSYDVVATTQQAYEGGKAFGNFQNMLADVDVSQLTEVIPNFHHILFRLEQMAEALKNNPADRALHVKMELDFVNARAYNMSEIDRLGKTGKLPVRVTHNDTKFNNVLLDSNDFAQCVIDLDTVMPGYTAFDFGDAVRTIINSAPEDEPDLEKITLNMPLFKAFAEGFVSQTVHYMTANEIRSLVKGVLLLPYMIGVRFLTDYLNGDTYFKIKFPKHNLQRARAQFRLVEKLEERYDELYYIILQSVNENKALNEVAVAL
ncbi:phosphotransferase enzyme family protein [Mucilaginibacter paludis]|uniref:Aminoglycoside phosphotransferase n=1 Tax=Mucilaginibacter paludis DSM 18603 TaxID=714943 RepID=H1Y5I3_9SPHI|nr:aminoglycoside phosphotransferase family protein [Mucilaginibacter paludis]EHQ29335.1 aminoglycoside phosphotransferase [Mucilaginibacter paludis DSM 18603]